MTPGKFIISASPTTSSISSKNLISSESITAPEVSNEVAGTQEDAVK